MNALLQTGSSGRAPVPPEKRFLITLGMPCVVGAGGVERIAAGKLNPDETEALSRSAQVLRDTLARLEA